LAALPPTPVEKDQPLIQVRQLKKHFPIRQGLIFEKQIGSVKAVDGITFDIRKGGNPGSGGRERLRKTTAGRTILGLYPITAGSVMIAGISLENADKEQLKRLRRKAQMISRTPMPHSIRAGR